MKAPKIGTVQHALAVKAGKIKLTDLPQPLRKKVDFVMKSGMIDHMTGKEKPIEHESHLTPLRVRAARTV